MAILRKSAQDFGQSNDAASKYDDMRCLRINPDNPFPELHSRVSRRLGTAADSCEPVGFEDFGHVQVQCLLLQDAQIQAPH